ncbi:hypothetical protein LINPERPRIM_LOCUS3430, partial [Linum perenne]
YQKAGYGVIISNPNGQVLDGKAGSFYCSSSIVSEARALFHATQAASAYQHGVTIHSDCLNVISAINGPKHRWSWECLGYLGKIESIRQDHPDIRFIHISRNSNTRADEIARKARLGLLIPNWLAYIV